MTLEIEFPALVRGEWQDDGGAIAYEGETQRIVRSLPDPVIDKLVDRAAARTERLYNYRLSDIVDLLNLAGQVLVRDWDDLVVPAIEAAEHAGGMSPAVLRHQYSLLPHLFERDAIMRSVRRAMDPLLLDEWVELECDPAVGRRVARRAFGARSVHIIAGNSPLIGASTIIQSLITRSDAIIKIPSTDPLSVAGFLKAIERAGATTDLLAHLSAVYWKGGEERVEERLLQSGYAEKIVAWGGMETVRSAMRNMSHDTEVITYNPKLSRSIIDLRDASEAEWHEAALRLARDIASLDQQACFNTRLAYVLLPEGRSGELIRFVQSLAAEIAKCPPQVCGADPVRLSPEIGMELEGLEYGLDNHVVVRGANTLLIASPDGTPVDFADRLGGRVANIVAIDKVETALADLDRDTQTLSVYPDRLRVALRDRAALAGVQRVVSCGASSEMTNGGPHDGMEPLRRLVFWASDEQQNFPPAGPVDDATGTALEFDTLDS